MSIKRSLGLQARSLCSQQQEDSKEYETSYQRAHETGAHALAKEGQQLCLAMLQGAPVHASAKKHTKVETSKALLAQPELRHLPTLLNEYIATNGGFNQHNQRFVDVVKTATLVDERWYMTGSEDHLPLTNVRAAYSYHGRQCFDSVRMKARNGRSWAQIRLLFWFQNKPLCLVRWYRKDGTQTDKLCEHGCVRLGWATHGKSAAHYEVVELDAIAGSAYVIQDHACTSASQSKFHASVFKWNRDVPLRLPVEDATSAALEERWALAKEQYA